MKDPVIYTQLDRIEGPLIAMLLELSDIGYGEAVQLVDKQGRTRNGRRVVLIVLMDGDKVTIF
ncbi:hypothetical protein [Psychromonas aquimarina]|uniref:hypothetical protein n=1 Tax=Psychromonas aquimarina TaxID=444919 RepID=UPI00041655DD|nr:hypothetical protein [Psychromonas aquimarina]